MWKKDEVAADPSLPATHAPSRDDPPARRAGEGRASIGSSITIRGEVTGDEDLLIEGQVDGAVDLGKHTVTVGSEGRVKAGITGRVVTVEGTVQGDLRAEEVVVLRSTARVEGDITAPRLVLEDGASFRGAVDMGGQAEKGDRVERNRSRGGGKTFDTRTAASGSGGAKEGVSGVKDGVKGGVGTAALPANGSIDGASAQGTAGLDA